MTTTQLPPCKCPTCDTILDAATSTDGYDTTPKAGDVTVCIYCNDVLEFTDDMEFIHVDIKTLPQETQDQIVMMVIGLQDFRPQVH